MASFAVEDFSLDRFRGLEKPDIHARCLAFDRLTWSGLPGPPGSRG
jgi:hypothetical protein